MDAQETEKKDVLVTVSLDRRLADLLLELAALETEGNRSQAPIPGRLRPSCAHSPTRPWAISR